MVNLSGSLLRVSSMGDTRIVIGMKDNNVKRLAGAHKPVYLPTTLKNSRCGSMNAGQLHG